jgi:hypothetical protein
VLLQFQGTTTTWLGNASLLAAAGDVNGDGYPDLAVSSPAAPTIGFETDHVSIFFGGPGGPPLVPSRRIDTPLGAIAHFGIALAALDADQDGLEDLAVGVDAMVTPSTAAVVFLGQGASTTLTAPEDPSVYEREVGSSGDVDGDGYPDLVVADPSRVTAVADAGVGPEGGIPALHGAVEIHRGGPNGVETSAKWTLLPPDTSAVAYGAAVVRP